MAERRLAASAWDALLKRYVSDRGLVDYRTWKQNDVPALEKFLDDAGCVDAATLENDDERLAYWINVYNAVTIRGILHFYPTKSIKDHVSRLVGFNIWQDYAFNAAGKDLSLDDIEHGILRRMREPRIHFAIVCAAMGCPRLRTEAYEGARVREQLQDQAIAFFADPSKLRLEMKSRVVHLSPILDWFAVDFGPNDSARLRFVAQFVDEKSRSALEKGGFTIRYLDYDWSLNERRG